MLRTDTAVNDRYLAAPIQHVFILPDCFSRVPDCIPLVLRGPGSSATLIVAPILVLMVVLRRQMVAGLTFSAVK
ncbi:hypothetical protein AB6813_04535 [bacterium RCC_150]